MHNLPQLNIKDRINSPGVWVFLIMLLIFAMRLPVSSVSVIDWDESVYFAIAQDITNGGVPYKTTWDTKGPFLFFVFVPVIALFDENIAALRIFTNVYLLVSMFFLYLLARRFFQGFTSVVPPLIYGLFFITPGLGGYASNGELFMTLPVILALLSYVDYEKKGRLLFLFTSGVFTATAFFTKGTAIFSALVIPLFIIYRNLIRRTPDLKSFLKETAWYSFGILSISLVLTLYFALNGALQDFYRTYFVINRLYTDAVPLADAAQGLIYFVYGSLFRSREFVTVLAAVSALVILIQLIRRKLGEEERRAFLFILALALLSLVGVLWGRRMFPHYYLQMGLPYSLTIAFGISILGIQRRYIQGIIILMTAVFMIYYPITRTVDNIRKKDYEWHEAATSYEVADYIRSNTTEDQKILVIGGQPVIQFFSDRRPPIKDFWWPNHHQVMFEILNLKDTVPGALRKNKPEYVAFYDGKHERQITRIGYIDDFISENYGLEKEIGGYKLYRLKQERNRPVSE